MSAVSEVMMVRGRGGVRALVGVAFVVLLLACGSQGALGAGVWRIDSSANTTAAPGSQQRFLVQVTNVGEAPIPVTVGGDDLNCVSGSSPPSDPAKCYTISAQFPVGMTPVDPPRVPAGAVCSVDTVARTVTCSVPGSADDQQLIQKSDSSFRVVQFAADVDADAPEGVATASFDVSGGEASNSASTVDPTIITSDPPVFGIDAFDTEVSANAAGDALTQAGGRPFAASTSIDFNTAADPNFFINNLYPVEGTKDIIVDLPPGFVGNLTTVDECSMAQLANGLGTQVRSLCPSTSQIGTTTVRMNGNAFDRNSVGPVPVFNMTPPPDVPGRLAFNIMGTIVTLDVTPRPGDYGLTARLSNVPEGLAIQGSTLTLWGVPQDPVHDSERACPDQQPPHTFGPTCASGAPRRALLRNPTSCGPLGEGLATTLRMDSWVHPGVFVSRTIRSHLAPGYPADPSDTGWGEERGTENCENVPFDPVLKGSPETGAKAGQPAGFSFDLALPQSDDPDAPAAESDLKKAVVTLPEGVRVSPSSAAGLAGCSSAQIRLGDTAEPSCPSASKIGDVTIDTPLLKDPLPGAVYLASPFDNPSHSLIALYLVARGPGFVVKIAGQASMDARSGQITTTFDDNPQVPFSRLHLQLDGGPFAPLSLPRQCGTYTTHAELTGWNGRTVSSESSFSVSENAAGKPCREQFSPGWQAGTESSGAGSSSPFDLRLSRGDDDQEFRSLTVGMPQGLLGRIADADLCPDAAALAGTCGVGSRIGNVTVGAGAGSNPFYITDGNAYLTGPYKGAPFGVAIVVHAQAGPFDLGNVIVRSALFVDKHDASVRIVSDTLPSILQGIPLNVRDVRVSVDKPGFIINPTSCAKKSVDGSVESIEGTTAHVSSRFQAFDCASLGFRPRMVLRVGGRGHTRRGRTTPLSTTLTMPRRGQANLRFVRVTLPDTINARLTVIQDACTRQEFESDITKCAHARAGSASASTPLLRAPLRGSAYFVKNGHPIPDLFVALRGQVDFDLIGEVSIVNNRLLRTTFPAAPDVPIRSFSLRLLGDTRNGSVGAAANLCSPASRHHKAALDYIAQNGKVLQIKQALKVAGCGHTNRHRRRSTRH